MNMTFDLLARVVAQCAKDHAFAWDTDNKALVSIYEVKVEPRFDPNWVPFETNAPDRDKDFNAWLDHWKNFNYEGNATHQVELVYPNKSFAGEARALYGVNAYTGAISLW